ncbi:MAG: hypothetical protein PSX36_04935 [bacterium]|nr:hypothetical protein [bacterium]
MKLNYKYWLNISIFNLLIIAVLGVIMRYKIGYEFPYFDQKSLQHAHSHFAFVGWLAHTLYVLMIWVIQQDKPLLAIGKYKKLLIANLICAYGMLISFSCTGYSWISIVISTCSILVSYLVAYNLFKDLKSLVNVPYKNWFKAALWFNIVSSLGTFTLAYHIARHIFNQKVHLASLYYYLHFQYNGFFTFACLGLFISQLPKLLPAFRYSERIFTWFAISCVFSYLLSILWLHLPLWLLLVVVAAALLQASAWIFFLLRIKTSLGSATDLFKKGRLFFLLVALALSVKFTLQLGSTIPAVSQLAFGFRPIVIAYLHLILLAIISVFLVSYLHVMKIIHINKLSTSGILVFIAGVYLNELILGIQGIASFSYTSIPYGNLALLAASLVILISLVMLLLSQRRSHTVQVPDVDVK